MIEETWHSFVISGLWLVFIFCLALQAKVERKYEMDDIDREALKSNYKGMDDLDREALDPKWFKDAIYCCSYCGNPFDTGQHSLCGMA